MAADYSLYLVTDSTHSILGGKDLIKVVQQALEGGVTIVQYRDKISNTKHLISTAVKLHTVTKQFGVPLLINDRVDVALAMGAEGVHIGQDDMELKTARKILGPKAIIGVSCSTAEQAEAAALGGANYLGIGTVFATLTKPDTKSIIGIAGTRAILERLSSVDEISQGIATVAIGGINSSNIQRVLFQSKFGSKSLNGVAAVSCIMAAEDPEGSARELRRLWKEMPPFYTSPRGEKHARDVDLIIAGVPDIVKRVGQVGVLSHNMINQVVINFAANVALAVGARPIMSSDGREAEDLAQLGGCLVINMGTLDPPTISSYLRAIQAYNSHGGPVLLDPVGAGATQIRRDAVKVLMDSGYFDVIKGNESEIKVVIGTSKVQQRGVDSGSSDLSDQERAHLVKRLAMRERNIVVMTGAIDFVSDGDRTYAVRNGDTLLGTVTGTGCTLGTTIASFVAVESKGDKLMAALAGILMFEIAAEHASAMLGVRGPGTFVPFFIDSLSEIARLCKQNDASWLEAAKIELIDV